MKPTLLGGFQVMLESQTHKPQHVWAPLLILNLLILFLPELKIPIMLSHNFTLKAPEWKAFWSSKSEVYFILSNDYSEDFLKLKYWAYISKSSDCPHIKS